MARRRFQRNYGNFSADIEDIVTVNEKRMTALMRQSLQDVINNASQSTAKGGRMRVDTGFLRGSGKASLTGMPSGPTRGEKTEPGAYGGADAALDTSVASAIENLEMGNTFYFGWTANYAKYREVFDGFLEGALMQWGRIVAFNTDTIRQRVKK